MNEKITQPRILARLADSSDISKRQAEEFLKAFLSTLSDAIADHETVKIKGFGTFKVSKMEARKSVNVSTGDAVEIPSHYKVSFVPDKKVAMAVNAPFDMFDTVELDDEIEEAELQQLDEPEMDSLSDYETNFEVEEPDAPMEVPEAVDDETTVPLFPSPIMNSEHEEEKEQQEEQNLGEKLQEDFGPIAPAQPFGPIEPDDHASHNPAGTSITHASTPDYTQIKKSSFNKGLLVGFAATFLVMLLAFGALYFIMMNRIDSLWAQENREKPENTVVITEVLPEQSPALETPEDEINVKSAESNAEAENTDATKVKENTKEVSTPASDRPKYDTITHTRYLTTMAREHYGNYHLWPYIYMENASKLGHPDRIKPGTKVVIPDLAKYKVSASNPADIKKAKELGVQIYKKFNAI